MSEKAPDPRDAPAYGNVGVPVGCLIVIVCFFLPWTAPKGASAMEISGDPFKALTALSHVLEVHTEKPLAYTRVLYLVPILALSTLMLEITVPPGHGGRILARLAVLAAGATLCLFFVSLGILHASKLAGGFWGSLTGALFIFVGVLFNVFRGE